MIEFSFYTLLGVIFWDKTSCESLLVGLIAVNSSSDGYRERFGVFEYASLGAAVPLAFDTARSNFSLLSNCSVDILYSASQGYEKLALDVFIKLRQDHKVDAVLGPQLSAECVATGILASQWNIPMISHTCTSNELSDSTRFNTFLRTIGSSSIADVVIAILQHFKWKNVAMIQTKHYSELFYEVKSIKAACENTNISISKLFVVSLEDSVQELISEITTHARSEYSVTVLWSFIYCFFITVIQLWSQNSV